MEKVFSKIKYSVVLLTLSVVVLFSSTVPASASVDPQTIFNVLGFAISVLNDLGSEDSERAAARSALLAAWTSTVPSLYSNAVQISADVMSEVVYECNAMGIPCEVDYLSSLGANGGYVIRGLGEIMNVQGTARLGINIRNRYLHNPENMIYYSITKPTAVNVDTIAGRLSTIIGYIDQVEGRLARTVNGSVYTVADSCYNAWQKLVTISGYIDQIEGRLIAYDGDGVGHTVAESSYWGYQRLIDIYNRLGTLNGYVDQIEGRLLTYSQDGVAHTVAESSYWGYQRAIDIYNRLATTNSKLDNVVHAIENLSVDVDIPAQFTVTVPASENVIPTLNGISDQIDDLIDAVEGQSISVNVPQSETLLPTLQSVDSKISSLDSTVSTGFSSVSDKLDDLIDNADGGAVELITSGGIDPYTRRIYNALYGGVNDGGYLMADTALLEVGASEGEPYYTWYGFDSHVAWCACFVSWCADQNGYLNDIVPKFADVDNGVFWYQDRSLWQEVGYEPSPGDIIFFDWDDDDDADHVGIVTGFSDGVVETVEGNTGDSPGVVAAKSYAVDSSVIFGYGTPDYPASGSSVYSVLTDISGKLDNLPASESYDDFALLNKLDSIEDTLSSLDGGSDEPITGSVYSTYYVPGDPAPTPGLNNLITNGNFADVSYFTTSRCSYTVDENVSNFVITDLNGVNFGSYSSPSFSSPVSITGGHKYYFCIDAQYPFYTDSRLQFYVYLNNWSTNKNFVVDQGNWASYETILSPNSSCTSLGISLNVCMGSSLRPMAVGDQFYFKNLWLIDLTEMYGAGNEPTLAEFRSEYPEISYNCATSLIPVTAEEIIDNNSYFPLDVDSQEYIIGDLSAHSDAMSFTVTADTVPDLRAVACLPNGKQIVCNNIIENVNALDEEAGTSVTYQVMLPAAIPWVDSWNIRLDGAHLSSIGSFNFLNLGASARAELQLLSLLPGGASSGGYDDTALLNKLDQLIENQQENLGLTSCEHNYISETVQEPTCILPGIAVYTCSECGEAYNEIVDAYGHDWLCTDHVVDILDSDTGDVAVPGYDVYTCSVCGEIYNDYAGIGAPENENGSSLTDLISRLFSRLGSFAGGLISSVINLADRLLTGFDDLVTDFNYRTLEVVDLGGDYPIWLGGLWDVIPVDLQLVLSFCVVVIALGLIGKKVIFT